MAAGRKLLLPSSLAVLFYVNLLSAFLGEKSAGYTASEGVLRHSRDVEKTIVEFDSIAPPIAADSSKRGPLGSRFSMDDAAPYKSVPITFEPSSLDFREQSVGMPRLERVELTNPSPSHVIRLNSISGDSPVFHASFFKSKVVKPGESTTFDVVFLARAVGAVHNTLYIHTSMGTFDYRVQGVGVTNPFRLRPLLGARIPLNATYSPQITMYNPFSEPLQISEMYSSGGELHIELLTGQPQGSKALWEIRPFETKTIARANFFGRVATNHTSFIRIKTGHSSSPSIVLPVEVEVSDNSRMYLSRELMDFGIVKTGDSKSLPLNVLNSGVQEVHIRSISVQPENPAVDVEYMTTMLKPGSKYSKVAVITLHADRVTSPSESSGKLVIRVEDTVSHQLEVPYEATILQGSLSYEKSQTLFRVGQPPFSPVTREIPMTNQFNVPVVLYDVKLPSKAQEYFSVFSFTSPFVLPPKSDWYRPFSIQFTPTSSECSFNTTLKVSTNATYFSIPLLCYDGRVQYTLENPDEDVLDYGILSDTDESIKTFAIHNHNPVTIQITSYTVSVGLPHTTVELVSIYPTDPSSKSTGGRRMYSKSSKPPFDMEPGYSALFRVNVSHPQNLGAFSGEILVHTSFERVVLIPVFYRTAPGGLKVTPERIDFGPVFPYSTSEVPVNITNYYRNAVTVTVIKSVPKDVRLFVRPAGNHKYFPRLKPAETTQIGKAVFDPLLESSETVYLGLVDEQFWTSFDDGGHQSDPSDDMDHFSQLWRSWNSRVEQGKHSVNLSILVELDVGTEVRLPATASLVWPSLLHTNTSSSVVEFPTTTIGNSSLQVVEVSNPSNYPVTVQPVFLHHYTRPHAIIDMLSELNPKDIQDIDFSQSSSSFAFLDEQKQKFSTESSVASSVLPPQSEAHHIVVAFTPKVEQTASTLLLIRNNLTVLDYVLLQGQGSLGTFTIDDIQPNSDPLTFEFTSAMLEKCQAGLQSEPLKMTKVFRMQNSGSTSLTLHMIGVGGGGCEEHGFAIANCDKELVIKPNKTKRIEISFHPDFTLSRVSNTLRVHTSGTELLFPLVATLPHHLLAPCYATQPRPEWEKNLAWVSVYFWILALFMVVGIALARTKCGVKNKLTYQTDNNLPLIQPTGGKLFDLKELARSVQNTITRKITDLGTRNNQPVETIKSTTSTLPTKDDRRDTEPPNTVSPAASTSTTPSPGSHHQSNGSKPHHHHHHRHHLQAQQPSLSSSSSSSSPPLSSTATITMLNTSTFTPELSSQRNYPNYSAAPSDLRLRQTGGSSTSSHTTSSSKDPPPSSRQMVLTSSTAPSDALAKSSVALSSSREKTAGTAVAKHATQIPPSVVAETDKLTGTYSVISPKHVEEQLSSSSSDRKLSDKLERISTKKLEPSHSTHSRESPQPVTVDSSASSTPPNQRKLKPSRRSGSKLQRSPQAPELKNTPPPASLPVSLASVTSSQMNTKTEGFIRKESESSIKSTDSSESTSSSEKLDDRDDAELAVSPEVVEAKTKVPHPLAKEPNTGQTVPVTPVSETPDISEMKNTALEVHKKDNEETTSAVSGRGKGKKRPSRQQLKREEKPKRKERERDRERERERDRDHRRERGTKDHLKHERANSNEELIKQRPASGESSSSNSMEQLYEDQNDQRGESQEADDEKSDVSSLPDKDTSQKLDSKPVKSESPKPETPLTELKSPQKSDRSSRKLEEADVHISSTPLPVVPVPSVPSTAVKTGRGKSSMTKQRSDDGHSEPVHRSSKKSSSKKTLDRSSKGTITEAHTDKAKQQQPHAPVESPPAPVVEAEQREEEGEESSSSVRPQTLPVIEVESEELIVSADSGSVEVDGAQHKLHIGAIKASQIIPTSPHELAASLLSNNSAIKRRSRQRGDKGQGMDDGNEDGEYDEDESEEGSDGDTHPTVSYQPASSKHPMMDHSPHKLQGPPSYHQGPHQSHRRIMMKPPSTLSLDAEPFYPTNFPSKGRQGGHPRMTDHQKYAQEFHHEGQGPMPSRVPPGFSPEDAVYMQQGPYHDKHFKPDYPSGPLPGPRSRPLPHPPHHHSKSMTPTPPSPPSYGSDGQHFPYMEHPGMEPPHQEHVPSFRTPPSHGGDMAMYDAMEDPGTPSFPPMGGGRRFPDQRRDLPMGGVDSHHPPKSQGGRHVTPTGAGPYPEQYMASLHHQQRQQQQHMGGGIAPPYRPSRVERAPSGFTVTGQRSLWENPNSYHLQPLPGGEDPSLLRHQEYLRKRSILLQLYQQEQAALEAAVAREQAKRSAETLTSLNQPYRSRSSGMGGKVDLSSPVGAPGENLWEGAGGGLHDPIAPPQGFDDPGLSESILRQRQMHYLASQPPARSRTYSGESEIGGEFVSNPVQVPSSIGHPGLNRAPGPGTSEGRGQSQRSSLDHTTSSGWPSRSRTEGSQFSKLWSNNDQSEDNSSLPFASNTYDLFENQSIWSTNNSTSSGLLSWAQYRADPQEQDDTKPES